MTYGEAWRMVGILTKDPGTQIAAALAEWAYPAGRELQATWDLYDLTHKVAAGKKSIKPYPRPWDAPKVYGANPTMSQAGIIAALRSRGHMTETG